jgi:hypothetical protein
VGFQGNPRVDVKGLVWWTSDNCVAALPRHPPRWIGSTSRWTEHHEQGHHVQVAVRRGWTYHSTSRQSLRSGAHVECPGATRISCSDLGAPELNLLGIVDGEAMDILSATGILGTGLAVSSGHCAGAAVGRRISSARCSVARQAGSPAVSCGETSAPPGPRRSL